MKIGIFSTDGETKKQIQLPGIFEEDIRPDIIKRSVLSTQSARKKPKGTHPRAGKDTSAETPPKGSGRTRVRRIKGTGYHAAGRSAWAPFTKGGRRAHPPKPEKRRKEDINKKEKDLALRSAVSATKEKEVVTARGHEINGVENMPIVLEDEFEEIKKTREVKEVLEKIGVWEDVERVKNGKSVRSGRGKTRGRVYKNKIGPLIVVGEDSGIIRGARNIPGVDVALAKELNTELLAPGGDPIRLTIWTESAIEEINRRLSS